MKYKDLNKMLGFLSKHDLNRMPGRIGFTENKRIA